MSEGDDLTIPLRSWACLRGATLRPLGRGLINDTWLARTPSGERWVVQRVNAIFSPEIHENIAAVTNRLLERGLPAPRLVRSDRGELSVPATEGRRWRVMSYIEGATFRRALDAEQCAAAGRLVGKFHLALSELAHRFRGLRVGVHDTEAHMNRLAETLESYRDHRLFSQVAPVAEEILRRFRELPPLPSMRPVNGHGDLKLDNIRFQGDRPPESHRALCLLDLDTCGPIHLAYELGDALRSWCNRAGEDEERPDFDLAFVEASVRGYRGGLGRPLSETEKRAILLGIEWVSLELAARFTTDALREEYFGYDASRYAGRGEHNLQRAQGQLALHRVVVASRPERASLLGLPRDIREA